MMTPLILVLAISTDPMVSPVKELEPLAFLVGRWKGQGEAPGIGKYTDEFLYEWNPTKTFLKNRYTMTKDGATVWTDDSVIGFDSEKKVLVGHTFGVDGSMGRGEWQKSDNPKIHIIEGKTIGNSPFKEWKITMSSESDTKMTVKTEVKEKQKWTVIMTSTYEKVPDSK